MAGEKTSSITTPSLVRASQSEVFEEVPYEFVKTLGFGGAGVVEEVRDGNGTRLARKRYRYQAGLDDRVIEGVRHKMELLRKLAHKHIITNNWVLPSSEVYRLIDVTCRR